MSSKQGSLDKVKDTLVKLKESIDEAEEREIEAGQQKREADNRMEKAEEEKESYKRRLVLLQADLVKTKTTLEEKQSRLDQVEGRSENDEEKRKEYEGIEMERDDELNTVEDEARIAKEQSAESAHVLMETQRKLQVLEGDLEKVYQRLDAALAKENNNIDTIERNGEEMRDLESREDDAAEREVEAEEKLRFLEDQFKEVVSTAENAERDVVRNENIVTSVMNDLSNVRDAHNNIGTEIDKIDELVDMLNSGKFDRSSVQNAEPQQEPSHSDDGEDDD
ncbi:MULTISPECIES: tropomyosin [unclassified Salmonella]|uniref:tropomyosin n=1 Tax=unclassified Salmonella TaxID=2614656 RepID=UPI0037554098